MKQINNYRNLILFMLLNTLSISLYAQTYSSAEQRVNILELYTSEGCSSCPPADTWLSGFKDDSRLWKELVPLAFHVDYWDYIGWQDRFAQPQFSQRQRLYARQNNLRTVYTPGILLNGKEWRSWFFKKPLKLDKSQSTGTLKVTIKGNYADVRFNSRLESEPDMVFNIALLGFDLLTQVKAGENKGRQLRHDFVVLAHHSRPMKKSADGFMLNQVALPQSGIQAKRLAIVGGVNKKDELTPIQATGGWFDYTDTHATSSPGTQ